MTDEQCTQCGKPRHDGYDCCCSTAVWTERQRCVDILQAARVGKVDSDLRCLIHWIKTGKTTTQDDLR